MNALVRGQKLPIFSGNGLPHDRVSAQIVRQARLLEEQVEFSIVFAAMGVKHDVAEFFIRNFQDPGALGARRHVLFPGRCAERGAAAHAARRSDLGRAPGFRLWPARARAADRHDKLLREPARSRHGPRRNSRPQRISGLSLLGPSQPLRTRRPHRRLAGIDHPDANSHHARRRHQPSCARPDRLHHRRADRAGSRLVPARRFTRPSPACRACRA